MTTTPQRPAVLELNVAGIPTQLTRLDQWVAWRWKLIRDKQGNPKWTKEPVNTRTGNGADTTNPKTWTSFSGALTYFRQNPAECDGVGFVFSANDPFCGIDLDKARNPITGELTPEAQAIVDRFDSFTECSITGTGAHIFVAGSLKADGNRRAGVSIEVYDRNRFFVVSGNVVANPGHIADRDDELAIWHREVFPSNYAPKPERTGPLSTESLSVSDEDLLQRCNGNEKFRRLYAGDDSDYGDDTSSADLAFCNIGVRNGGDRRQVDSLYRRSERARDKWDQKRGEKTYGDLTLDQAFDGTVVPFTPQARIQIVAGVPKPQDADMVGDDLPDDIASLKSIIIDLRNRVIAAEERAASAEAKATALSDLQSKTTSIIRNSKLGQERFTAVALAYQLGNREATGDEGTDGLHRMPLARIAEAAGVSDDTASKHLQKLAKENVIRREVRWVPEKIDRVTGEITPGHKALFVGTVTNVTDFVEAVARLEPDAPKKWGGSRIQCPHHPTADVIKRTTWHCAECNEQLRPEEVTRIKPQDADMVEPLAATGTDGPPTRYFTPSVDRQPLSSVNGATSHKTGDLIPNSIAASWLNAQPIAPKPSSPVIDDPGVVL